LIDEKIVKKRLALLVSSKVQDEKKISDLDQEAKILRKRLQIETD